MYFIIYLLFYFIYLLLISLAYELGLLEALFNYLLFSFNVSSLRASLTDYEHFKYVCVTMYFMRLWTEIFPYIQCFTNKIIIIINYYYYYSLLRR